MIVRDEAHHLPDCLASLAPLVDRVVVCDTGSTDDTIPIAQAAGADVVHFDWIDDFSAARNSALDACRDAMWVISIDADERLVCDDPHKARLALSVLDRGVTGLSIDLINDRGAGPTSVARVMRVVRPGEHHFEGAIHEQLVTLEGVAIAAEHSSLFTIVHHGYNPDSPNFHSNRVRNLRIARTQHDHTPTPRSALDLARSLADVGSEPAELLGVVEPALADAVDPSQRADLLAVAADSLSTLGDWRRAQDTATDLLAIDSSSDIGAAVSARAALELGQPNEVLDLNVRFDRTGTTAIRVPRNVAAFDAAVAGAYAALGDTERAIELAALVNENADSMEHALRLLLDTFRGVDQDTTSSVLTSVGGSETGRHLAAILESAQGAQQVFDTPPPPSPSGGAEPSPQAGITLDLDGLDIEGVQLGVSPRDLLDLVPPRRRILDLTDDEAFATTATTAGHRLTTHPPADPIPPTGQRFDIIVVKGVEWLQQAAEIRLHLDPAGMLVVWDRDLEADELERLASSGYMPEQLVEGVTQARPIWDETMLARDEQFEPRSEVVALTSDELAPELRLAFRASLPGDVAIRWTAEPADLAPDSIVFALSDDVVPEPAWVQQLWDSVRDSGTPAGARMVDQYGRVVHAGAIDGAAVGVGEDGSSPLLMADRADSELLAPFAAPASQITDDPPRGRLIGSAVALSLATSQPPAVPPGLPDIYPSSVAFFGGPAPGREDPTQREQLAKTFARLIDAGVTPIYQPASQSTALPQAEARWRRDGVVLIPAPPRTQTRGLLRPDPIRPQAAAIRRSLRPKVVVYLSAEAIDVSFTGVSAEASRAAVVFAGQHVPEEATVRADVICDPVELADRVCDWLDFQPDDRPRKVVSVPPVDQVAGLTSIVIPVWNRWDLTRACLDTINRHTDRPTEIIVVDNGSTDDTSAALQRMPVTVITNEDNLGFPTAVNQGLAAATGEFVCILNNDTQVTHGWLDALIDALDQPDTGLAGPRTNEIGGLQRVPDALAPDQGRAAHRWAKEFVRARKGQTWTIDRLVGFCLLGRRSLFETVGGFDEGFGLGNFEDDELGRRVQAEGLSLRVADDSFVLHHGSATFKSMGVDYDAALHHAARHMPLRSHIAAATSMIVLSDGDAQAAAITAATGLLIADDVRIIERRSPIATEMAARVLAGGSVPVEPLDWATDEGAERALAGAASGRVLVLEAGEQIDVVDWGSARAELESLPDQPAEVHCGDHSEVRVVPAVPGGVALVGSRADVSVEGLRIR